MLLLFVLLLAASLALVYYSRKLTAAGTVVAGLLALLIFKGTGWPGIALLGTFFLLGTGATQWRKSEKEQSGFAGATGRGRHAGQVLANGGVAALAGLCAWVFPEYRVPALWMQAGALAAATADTMASELGVLYGSRYWDLRTGKAGAKGSDGVVSVEGTLLGVLGSLLVALVLGLGSGTWQWATVAIAGTVGNLVDSLLGATLERRGGLQNDAVNLLNTLAGAGTMALFYLVAAA